jgi:hypothetical protein
MIPVLQDTFYDESTPEGRTRGNCWSAAIASLVEVPLNEVPNFVQEDDESNGEKDWWDSTMFWLDERGLVMKQHSRQEINSDEYYIVTGRSYRFDGGHAVIYHGWNMAHDPFPGGMGVTQIWGIYSIKEKS